MLFLLQPSKVLRWVVLLKHTELSYVDIFDYFKTLRKFWKFLRSTYYFTMSYNPLQCVGNRGIVCPVTTDHK